MGTVLVELQVSEGKKMQVFIGVFVRFGRLFDIF
jgi:hypothetical protein